MRFPFKKVVFDGGAVIELLLSGEESELYKNIDDDKIIPSITILAIIETEYILCRKLGKEKAFEKTDNLLSSNYFKVFSLDSLLRDISVLKCFTPIALPDCATIALAIKNNIPALFAKKESELIAQLKKKNFDTEIYFLEDLIDNSKI
ncbi:MAG: PIN domain-containing protein [Promethearchaeota archaeon]